MTRRPRAATLAALLGLLAAGGCGDGRDAPPSPPAARTPGPADPAAPAPPAVGQAPPALVPPTPRGEGSPEPADPRATSRWYEILSDGQKAGWLHVVWAPSTWEGKPTIHDTSRETQVTARRMDRTVDLFETETLTELERGEDGTLWWMKRVITEASDRVTTVETTWRGDGYEEVTTLAGQEHRRRVATPEPVPVDVEVFAAARLREGAKAGDRFDMRVANFAAQRVDVHVVEVVGPAQGPGVAGPVPVTVFRERDPRTRSETLVSMDAEGAFAAVRSYGTEYRRVAAEVARQRPEKTASFSITLPSSPPLERIFSADEVKVDVHLRGDPDRPLPELPATPFGRVTGVDGSDEKGWVVHATLTAHDAPDATATYPVTDPAFAKDLEATPLMPCAHADLVAAARRAIAGEADARRAVERISHFVFTTLDKESPAVAETTALEILEQQQGDCSEHALLFVALCRAVGIPARRCSGYVCVGEMWGAHAWAEAWTGAWIGVDPTTDDVGTAARYLFFGYSDDPDSYPGVVSARVRNRMRIVTTELREGRETVDLRDPANHRVSDAEAGVFRHRLAGIEMRGVPSTWRVALRGDGEARVSGDGWSGFVNVVADQGMRDLSRIDGERTPFAGAPAVRSESDSRTIVFAKSRRRRVVIGVSGDDEARASALRELERVLAPTFALRPRG